MDDLIIQGKSLGNTPSIEFRVNGQLKISGRSIPEDTITIYMPVFNWLESFQSNLPGKVELKVSLEYFNTSSSIHLLKLFNYLEHLHQIKQTNVSITWFYNLNDEEMLESGNDFKNIVHVPFEVIPLID